MAQNASKVDKAAYMHADRRPPPPFLSGVPADLPAHVNTVAQIAARQLRDPPPFGSRRGRFAVHGPRLRYSASQRGMREEQWEQMRMISAEGSAPRQTVIMRWLR